MLLRKCRAGVGGAGLGKHGHSVLYRLHRLADLDGCETTILALELLRRFPSSHCYHSEPRRNLPPS